MSTPTLIGTPAHARVGAGSSSVAVTYTGTTVGNSLIVLLVTGAASAETTSSCSDTAGNTYSNPFPIAHFSTLSTSVSAFLCTSQLTTSSNTITVSYSATTGPACAFVCEWSGLGPFDKSATIGGSTGNQTAWTTNAATPTVSGSLAIALFGANSAEASFTSWLNSYTQGDTQTNNPGAAWGYLITGAGSTSSGVTVPTTNPYVSALLLFKPGNLVSVTSSVTGSITGSSGTFTLGEAVASNDAVIVQWALNNVSGADIPTISDTVNGPYSILGSSTYYAAGTKAWGVSWIACRSAGAAPVITVSDAGMNNAQILVTHLSGFTAIPLVDSVASVNGTGTSIVNSANINFVNEIALSSSFSSAGTFSGTPSGWTSSGSGGNGSILQNYYQNPAIGNVNLSGTLSASGTFLNTIVSFYSSPVPTTAPLGGPRRIQWHWR